MCKPTLKNDANGVITYSYATSKDMGFCFHLLSEVGAPYQQWFRDEIARRNWVVSYDVELDHEPWVVDMRTTALSVPITTIAQAESYLFALDELGYTYHPEDAAADIVRTDTRAPLFTPAQAALADARMAEIYALPGHFDPCEYLMELMRETDRIDSLARPVL